jgi:hypothetical protein
VVAGIAEAHHGVDVAIAKGGRAEDVLAVESGAAKKSSGAAAKYNPRCPARSASQPVEKARILHKGIHHACTRLTL